MMVAHDKTTLAKFAGLYAGLVWGVFWIPLRTMETAGFAAVWSTALFYLIPALLLIPFFFWRARSLFTSGVRIHVVGLLAGSAFVIYANAFLYTEVIRAMLLYYLTPLWGFLLARIFMADPITPVRWLAMALGLAGMLVIFEIDGGLPLPRNIGDWMALISGFLWAIAALLLLLHDGDEANDSFDYALSSFLWGSAVAVFIAVTTAGLGEAVPARNMVLEVLPWLIPVVVIVVIPGAMAAIYCSTKLNPGVVGLLFMSEISVGAATAALFAGEPFGAREIIGIALITAAAVAEAIYDFMRRSSGSLDRHRP